VPDQAVQLTTTGVAPGTSQQVRDRFPTGEVVSDPRWGELLTERGITVGHVSVYRWVQRFTPLLIESARPR